MLLESPQQGFSNKYSQHILGEKKGKEKKAKKKLFITSRHTVSCWNSLQWQILS